MNDWNEKLDAIEFSLLQRIENELQSLNASQSRALQLIQLAEAVSDKSAICELQTVCEKLGETIVSIENLRKKSTTSPETEVAPEVDCDEALGQSEFSAEQGSVSDLAKDIMDEVAIPSAPPVTKQSPAPDGETNHLEAAGETSAEISNRHLKHEVIPQAPQPPSTNVASERQKQDMRSLRAIVKVLCPKIRDVAAKQRAAKSDFEKRQLIRAEVLWVHAVERARAELGEECNSSLHIDVWKEHRLDVPFFVLNRDRKGEAAESRNLGDAYVLFSKVHEAITLLKQAQDWRERHEKPIFSAAAASVALVKRSLLSLNPPANCNDAIECQESLKKLLPDEYVQWWKYTGAKAPSIESLVQEASTLHERLHIYQDSTRKQQKAHAAQLRLGTVIETIRKSEFDETQSATSFEHDLKTAIVDALTEGVQPTNKQLVELLIPYESIVQSLDHPQARSLCAAIRRQQITNVAKRVRVIDAINDEELFKDSDYELWLEEVRKYLRGKKLFILGGISKPANTRKIEAHFKLASVTWPDSDSSNSGSDFTSQIEDQDIVCQLIKWSRHSYKEVLDEAKARGKDTVVIKAGYGIRRLTHDFYHQLCRPAQSPGHA